jgi:hypothetical protein
MKPQVDSPMYDRLLSELERTFPWSADAFSSSLSRNLIERLRAFYLRSCSLDLPRSLDQCHHYFEAGLNALDAVGHLKFTNKPSVSKPHPVATDGIKPKQSQSQSKQAKRNYNQSPLTDSAPFTAIRKNVPRTQAEADVLVVEILAEQWKLLEV